MFLAVFLIPILALARLVNAHANPGACSGDCFAHDPAVIRRDSDGVYFRFNTGNEIGIWKSRSLAGPWTYQGKVLPSGSAINLKGNTDLWVTIPCILPSTAANTNAPGQGARRPPGGQLIYTLLRRIHVRLASLGYRLCHLGDAGGRLLVRPRQHRYRVGRGQTLQRHRPESRAGRLYLLHELRLLLGRHLPGIVHPPQPPVDRLSSHSTGSRSP